MRIAGHTSNARFGPAITTTRYPGIMTEIIAQSLPVIALSGIDGMPVTLASVVIGMPIEPNATGAGNYLLLWKKGQDGKWKLSYAQLEDHNLQVKE